MMANAEQLTAAALALPEEDRAELMAQLMASLDGPPDEGLEQAWADEIARRLAEVRSGTAATVSWAEVHQRLLDDADGDDR